MKIRSVEFAPFHTDGRRESRRWRNKQAPPEDKQWLSLKKTLSNGTTYIKQRNDMTDLFNPVTLNLTW